LYELNLGTFNGTFSFAPNIDLSHCQVPHKFNLNAFGMNFQVVLGKVPVHQNAHILGTLALE